MRVALEVVAVLERAGLALVDVDRHQPRRAFGAHDLPFAAGREAGAAEPAQRRVLHLGDHRVGVAAAFDAIDVEAIPAGVAIRGVVEHVGHRGIDALRGDRGGHRLRRRRVDRVLADDGGRRVLAAADAGRADHPHVLAFEGCERLAQRVGAGHLARQRLADAHGDRRRRRLAFLDDVEVVVERRHLVDLGHRQAHLLRQRGDVRGRQVAEAVLQLVQVLDQEVAPARRLAEHRAHLGERRRIDGATLRPVAHAAASAQLREIDDRAVVHRAPRGSGFAREPDGCALRRRVCGIGIGIQSRKSQCFST